MSKAKQLIAEAERWIGTKEKGGDNCGPEVEAFQKAVSGRSHGQPWCASFVQFCLKQVGGSDIFPSEHCMTIWHKSPEELKIMRPEPGCLVFWRKEGTSAGHMGIVVEVINDTSMMVIEGNTSPAKIVDRDGDGVYLKHRAIFPVTGAMRLVGFMKCWKEAQSAYGPAF